MSTIQAYGRDCRLIMARQVNFQTDATGNFVQIPFISFTAGSRRPRQPSEQLPSSRFPTKLVEGLRESSGELVVLLDYEWIGWHLWNLLGQPVTTGDAPSGYTHTFTLAAAADPVFVTFSREHLGLAAPVRFKDAGYCYSGMTINSSKAAGGQQVTFPLLGGRESKLGASLDSTPITPPADDLAMAYTATALIGGAPVADLVEFTASFTAGIVADQTTINGSPDPASIRADEVVAASGQFRTRLSTTALYDWGVAGTQLDVVQKWTNGLAGAAERSLELRWSNVVLEQEAGRVSGPGAVEINFPWRLDQPDVGVSPLVAVLKNGRASYAIV